MFRHLLVPLDGSLLAEAALPAAAHLAGIFGARLTLLHVIERKAPGEIHGETHLREPESARAYLEALAARPFAAGLSVEPHVHVAEVESAAAGIAAHIEELQPDLIVMCTHGGPHLRRWLSGSVAQKVLGLSRAPILLLQPGEGGSAAPLSCRRLLVPLDGLAEHEQGLAVAAALAARCSSSLHLALVVHTFVTLSGLKAVTARFLPAATSALLEASQLGAAEYLERQTVPLREAGLSVTAEIYRGEPAKSVVRAAQRVGADLIVLGTHARSGLEAFWAGSIAPKICSRCRIPLLLVPVGRSGALR